MPNVTEEGCATRFGAGPCRVPLPEEYQSVASAWQQNPAELAGVATLKRTNALLKPVMLVCLGLLVLHMGQALLWRSSYWWKGPSFRCDSGALAGLVLGVPAQSVRAGCGAAFAMASASAAADIFDRRLSQKDERSQGKITPEW